jgi:hypothetical protein
MGLLSAYADSPGRYVFHKTYRRRIDSILDEGLLRAQPGLDSNADIEAVIDELGLANPFPFDRSDAVYCHTDREHLEESYQSLQGSPLASDEVIVVVAVEEIEAPMYLADMSVISDLIDYRYLGTDAMMHEDSPEEVIQRYQESIAKVEGPKDIASPPGPARNHTELIIDGDVPPTAIAGVCP